MYESLTAAGTLSRESQEISRNVAQNISYRLGKNQLYLGFYWRKAKPDEYEIYQETSIVLESDN
jgi:hypothetical protein